MPGRAFVVQQGFNDLLIGLVSAAGSLSSGVLFATMGYATIGVIGALAALIALALAVGWRLGQRRLAVR